MIPARAKISGAYVNSAFAKSEALMNGFDEAIMLTSEGHVSEGSAENIFMLVNGELVTPSASENILLGITRDTIMQLARRELDRITRERVRSTAPSCMWPTRSSSPAPARRFALSSRWTIARLGPARSAR